MSVELDQFAKYSLTAGRRIADSAASALAHLPSGSFNANAA
ncbi:MAG TPA: hypothetical protein VE155_03715 [Pseudonocardiaceae bacterium]|nr:hypothetical protein [Pseudonocardiaceae bacterium]